MSLYLVIPSPRLPRRHARTSAIVAAALHALAVGSVVAVAFLPGTANRPPGTRAAPPAEQVPRMVFLQMPGPGGGGGGGGNRQLSPPSRAQRAGADRITLPVARPVRTTRDPAETVTSQTVALDAIPLASGIAYRPGTPQGAPSLSWSSGPGVGGGVGDGSGTGIGSGTGPGLGPGSGGGFGGGIHRAGNGVTAPTLRSQVRPTYTAEAMQRKIQGTVVLEMVVGRDGVPFDVRVARSLDATGLDEAAISAAREWRFNPGRIGETPVNVLVMVVIDFRIR